MRPRKKISALKVQPAKRFVSVTAAAPATGSEHSRTTATASPSPLITEDFLKYIWKFRLFNNTNLKTKDRQPVEILKPGEPNSDAGPDFVNARIRIGATTWAGNVEIHVNSSDWNKHGHANDNAYNNVILHAVNNSDVKIKRRDGEILPTLELKDRIDKNLLSRYADLINSTLWIPCQKQIHNVDKIIVHPWLDRLTVERIERRTRFILQSLEYNNNDWQESFYQHLARNFGFKVNSDAFQILARSLPLINLQKHRDNPFQVEALFFGQAGFLGSDLKDDYPNRLKKEYDFLKQKFSLKPIPSGVVQWKFLRLRPHNFPTLRISQFANLMCRTLQLFSKVIEANNVKDLEKLFDVSASAYWDNHFSFDREAPRANKPLGRGAVQNIITNTAVPFLFVYGKQKQIPRLCEKALDFLSKLPGEENNIIEKWKTLNMPVKNGYFTQALLELKNEYCDKKRCLSCAIGSRILRTNQVNSQ